MYAGAVSPLVRVASRSGFYLLKKFYESKILVIRGFVRCRRSIYCLLQ